MGREGTREGGGEEAPRERKWSRMGQKAMGKTAGEDTWEKPLNSQAFLQSKGDGGGYWWSPHFFTHSLILVSTEKAGVMAFLHHNVSDPRLVVFFQFDAGISNGKQLIVKDLGTR